MGKSLGEWKQQSIGKRISRNDTSYDCVDVPQDWLVYLSGLAYRTVSGYGNAKDIYTTWSKTHLTRIPRGNAPKLGDIICMDGSIGGGYGHTGVVVSIDGRNITIAQQNTFTQAPIHLGTYDGYGSNVIGYLRPNFAFTTSAAVEPYQRVVAAGSVHYRKEATSTSQSIEMFNAGEIINFKGYVRGQSVSGNNVWFVGRFTGGYSWSGGYTDTSTTGLPDLTPATTPVPTATQRQVAADALNVRSSAKVESYNAVRLIQPATIVDIKGYVVGQSVEGIDKWFVLSDNTYAWSGGFTNQSVVGFQNLTPVAPPITTPPVTPPTVNPDIIDITASDIPAWITYDEKIKPTPNRNTEAYDYYKTKGVDYPYKPIESHTHWWGDPSVPSTHDGVVNTMLNGVSDVNFVVSEYRVTKVIPLPILAYTTGTRNPYAWKTENDPRLTEGWYKTIGALHYIIERKNPRLKDEPIRLHKEFAATACSNIDVSKVRGYANKFASGELDIVTGQAPATTPDPVTPPTTTEPVPAPEGEAVTSAAKFIARLATQFAAAKLIVDGTLAILKEYNVFSNVLSSQTIGLITLLVAVAIIAAAQFGYKTDKFKWMF